MTGFHSGFESETKIFYIKLQAYTKLYGEQPIFRVSLSKAWDYQ